MATRVKKQSTVTKEIASPQTSKNEAPGSANQKTGAGGKLQNVTGIAKKLGRKATVKGGIPVKKTVQLKAKAKATRKNALKINPKNFARVLLENGKGLEAKKILLKNGTKEVVKRPGRKPKVPKIKKEPPEEDPPPVLEPIFPQEENLEVKKTPKKRGRKPYKLPELIEIKKIKSEPADESVGTSEDTEIPSLVEAASPKVVKKIGRPRKPKGESTSIEEVMTDLSFLIDSERIKKEVDADAASESSKTDVPKVKRLTKKQRLDLIKKDFTKKENIENTLSKLDPAEAKVIDRLDLNVRKFKTDLPRMKRRHSIEKFPTGSVDSGGEGLTMPRLSVFNQLPRSLSPKIPRKGIKLGGKRSSPYSTRSDSPARMLRNGKHRRLKDLALLDGLELPKRRRRVHSDLSGSETKLSGYESDSSFSDLASLHGSEKDSDVSKSGVKDVDTLLMDDSSNPDPRPSSTSDLITKVTASADLDKPLIDTNSNVCADNRNSIELSLPLRSDSPIIEDTPSAKVPEKGLLLDIMKQTFNDMNSDKSPTKCETSKIYGRSSMEQGHELPLKNESSASTQEMTDAATSTGDLSQAPPTQGISEEDELRQLLEETDSDMKAEKKPRKKTSNVEDFPTEDKEAEEEASFENIVQGCIDSISNTSPDLVNLPQPNVEETVEEEAPVLEKEGLSDDIDKDDSIPIIDNMSAAVLEPPQNLEHLDPPLLESSVLIPEPKTSDDKNDVIDDDDHEVIDDHKIGIAVTEKGNVVCFSIEHLTDDAEEHETSNEEIGQNVDEKITQSQEEEMEEESNVEELKDAEPQPEQISALEDAEPQPEQISALEDAEPQPEQISALEDAEPQQEQIAEIEEKVLPDQANEIIDKVAEISETEDASALLDTADVPKESALGETTCEQETVDETVVEEKEPLEEMEEVEEPQPEKVEAEEEEVTEKECDKPSETTDVEDKEENLENSKAAENVAEESPEELAQKENILNALGLQSMRAVKESVPPKKKGKASTSKGDGYTGTLKTVIKINKKKGKNSFKMTLQKHKGKSDPEHSGGEEGYKIMKEAGSSAWKHSKESSDTAGAHRKSHYSNRSNMEGSSEHTSDSEQASTHDANQPEKSLIVPEKASSFSIHPGRLCKDECSYCFGKFGLFDTPCHIAQMKSVDRQNKILASEKHLTRDSCLCDACYRHVDRKSNSPSYINKSLKRNSLVAPGPRQNHCHVLGCNNVSTNILRRKWIIKMRKSICQVINIDLDNPGLHSIPICDEHFTALEHLMVCAMCKRRLARNHIHYLGPEVKELNDALADEGIPISLCDKPVVCKLCKCFASIILKDPEERMENSINFFKEYKKRLLHFNNIVPMDSAAAEEPIVVPGKSDKSGDKKDLDFGKRRKRMRNSSNESLHSQNDDQDEKDAEDMETNNRPRVPSTDTNNSQSANQSRAQSPEDGDEYGGVDYNTLIPAIAMDCPSDGESKKDMSKKMMGFQRKMPKLESFGNAIEISRTFKNSADRNRSNDLAAQKLGQNPSISLRPNYGGVWKDEPSSKLISNPAISVRQLFPGEEELGLMGDIDFKNTLTRTPEGWEKCTATIQYDEETKLLWQELQKPYGSKSSFLRHLVLLEKYFRNGDLVLSPAASHHAINYRESVHNRLRAYDNIPSSAGNVQPPTMVQFNKMNPRTSSGGNTSQSGSNGLPPVTISQVGRENENQSSRTPITLQQLNQPPLYPTSSMLQNLAYKSRSSVAPPGLISINQRASGPATVRAQIPSQKIKFPITKNWRPNLIPIDPTKKNERKPGLVQVISGGKPYHITLEDYKKMCAIKRSFEAKQKKIQEQQQLAKQSILVSHNSVLKTVVPKKGLIISKTSGGTVTEGKPISLVPISSAPATITSGATESSETILEKLDKQVERLGQDPSTMSAIALEKNPAIQIIPRIPKSLTVIPQTVRKSGPPSPVLYITPKNSSSNGSSTNDSQP